MKIRYKTTSKFDKDLKKLSKKLRTLKDDIEVAKRNVIELYHLQNIDNHSVFPIQSFCFDEVSVFKIKKFACKSLKGKGVRSGIRVIYAFFPESFNVIFIEIYYKKRNNTIEDRDRIKVFLKENRDD